MYLVQVYGSINGMGEMLSKRLSVPKRLYLSKELRLFHGALFSMSIYLLSSFCILRSYFFLEVEANPKGFSCG